MLFFLFVMFILLIALEIWKDWSDGFFAVISIIGLLAIIILSFISYICHAQDLGVLRAQQNVIDVQTALVDSLEKRLIRIAPVGQQRVQVMLNADSPIKSLVEEISSAQKELTKATVKMAEAKVSIESRKAGPFWFVVSAAGEK